MRESSWLWGLILIAFAFVAYIPVWYAGFVWDDSFMIADNLMLRTPQGLYDLWFTNRFADPYRVTMTLLWLQWQLFGNDPLGYHVVNVLLHSLGCILVWRVFQRLALPAAWFAAAIFTLHPVCVASVAWVSEVKNTCSIIFYSLTFLSYLRFHDSGKKRWYAMALFSWICALMSKGSVVMLPVLFLLTIWWQANRITWKDILKTAPFFAMSLAAGLMTIWFQNHRAIVGTEVQTLNMLERIAAAAWVVWFYICKGWMPVGLSVIYPQWQISATSIVVWLPAAALLAIFAVCWRYRTSWGRHVIFGFGSFAVTLFPVMGLFNMYLLVYSRVVDHWQYLALVCSVALGACGGAWLFDKIAARIGVPKFIKPAFAVALLCALATLTFIRADVYSNEEKLWSDTVKKNPGAWMAFSNLGNALGAKGKTDEAIKCYRAALKLNPDFPDANSNLGNSLVSKKEIDAALVHLERAVKNEPRMPTFHFNYGVGLAEKGRFEEALKEYELAIKLKPNYADAHNNMANVLIKLNRHKEALEHAQAALQFKPMSSEANFNAGAASSSLGKTAEAIEFFRKAIEIRPEFAAAHYELGLVFATTGRVDQSLPYFRELVRLKPNEAVSHGSLATALASLDRFDEAIPEFKAALKIQPDDPSTLNNLGAALSQQGKFSESLQYFEASLKSNPNDAETRCNFGFALAKTGNIAKALEQYQQANRIRPNDPKIQGRIRELSAAKQ